MTEHNNPPAFPTKQPLSSDFLGLTMLDHFAGLAMQSQIGNPLKTGDNEAHRLIAERAYRMADAMLKERAKWIK